GLVYLGYHVIHPSTPAMSQRLDLPSGTVPCANRARGGWSSMRGNALRLPIRQLVRKQIGIGLAYALVAWIGAIVAPLAAIAEPNPLLERIAPPGEHLPLNPPETPSF